MFAATVREKAGAEQDGARARAVLALARDYLGLPWYRLPGYQAMLGVPVPEATQWDQSAKVGDCSDGGREYLERLAAQGALLDRDATAVRMLALLGENRTRPPPAE